MADRVVVPLRDSPSLLDVPNQLRALADDIEAGKHGGARHGCIVLLNREGDYPAAFGYGALADDPIVTLELAKAWFVHNLVERNT